MEKRNDVGANLIVYDPIAEPEPEVALQQEASPQRLYEGSR